ncbi:MAG: hypothetical protein IJ752_01420 [Alphaproteobacteria bacterium]|nr:hypothetical protein [Alphaproteobacteria bacterium]
MLILEKCIGKGAVRECYVHPTNKNKCVKVLLKKKDCPVFEREFKNYSFIKEFLNDYIIDYDKDLVETNKGFGMVCELLRDDDGTVSKMIFEHEINDEIKKGLDLFVYQLLEHNLFFYDFNLNNFVVQIKDGKKKLKYIDVKSFERNKSWCFLKLENIFSLLARIVMIRRLKRLYKELGFNFSRSCV